MLGTSLVLELSIYSRQLYKNASWELDSVCVTVIVPCTGLPKLSNCPTNIMLLLPSHTDVESLSLSLSLSQTHTHSIMGEVRTFIEWDLPWQSEDAAQAKKRNLYQSYSARVCASVWVYACVCVCARIRFCNLLRTLFGINTDLFRTTRLVLIWQNVLTPWSSE